MCGRFVLFTTSEALLAAAGELTEIKEVHAPQGTPGPRFNLAPTQVVPILRANAEGEATLDPARWGLFPHWKKDEKGPVLFNARGETVWEKPSFRDAVKKQRCLIPMNGYYEWHEKKPHFVSLGGDDTEIMWTAGLWATGLGQLSCTMVTTESKEPIEWLHDRMPRFLAEDEIQQWLCGTPDEARELLHPTPEDLRSKFVTRPADPAVGNVRNDYAELIKAY